MARAREDSLVTPIHLKTCPDMPSPDDPVHYLLAGNGLWLGRKHPLLGESCVPAPTWPRELARQAPVFIPGFDPIPGRLIEHAVGFMDIVGIKHGAEAIVLLVRDLIRNRYRIVVPQQEATIGLTHSLRAFPVGVEYQTPAGLPPGCVEFGSLHSHVNELAYSSRTDEEDERHRPGLHLIVGRIDHEPPDFRATVVVDGYRFELPMARVIDGYQKRRWRIPRSWMAKVRTRVVIGPRGYVAPQPQEDRDPTSGDPSHDSRRFRT
jgi:hypothetical protein